MILILVGKSGSGKTAIEHMLRSKYGYEKLPSCTTRKPRDDETDRDYRFMARNKFLEHVNNKEMAEWEVYDKDLYGTLKSDLESDKKLVAVKTPEGAKEIKNMFPDTFIVHINPSTKTAILRAIEREKEIDPAKIHTISNRAMTDYYLFNDIKVDCTIANERMDVLEDVVCKVVREHQKFIDEFEQHQKFIDRFEQHIVE